MYNMQRRNPCPYYVYPPIYNNIYNPYNICPNSCYANALIHNANYMNSNPVMHMTLPMSAGNAVPIELSDYGPEPFVVNIEEAAKQNNTFRTALWTGKHFQLTLMSINVGEDIGVEIHPDVDQFIRIEEGQGLVQMGDSKDNFDFQRNVFNDYIIIIPAGKWHNVINTGNMPIKLYSIYAPPQHPHSTVHMTKADAEENH